ncbi:hypothetical protein FDF36_07160 [Bacteroides fragilis]|nr:hypothetical protein [Bacteroides fragilis]
MKIEILLFKDIDFQMVYSKIRFFTSRMDSSDESRDTYFFVNYKQRVSSIVKPSIFKRCAKITQPY